MARFNVYSDCGTLVLANVTREEALEKMISGLTEDLHFTYTAKEVCDNESSSEFV